MAHSSSDHRLVLGFEPQVSVLRALSQTPRSLSSACARRWSLESDGATLRRMNGCALPIPKSDEALRRHAGTHPHPRP